MNQNISDDDKALFHRSMSDVQAMKHDKVKPPAPKIKSRKPIDWEETHTPNLQDIATIDSEASLFYAQSGIQPKQLKHLKQGKIAYQASLDLHGLKQVEAEQSLHQFIHHAMAQHYRCIHIIHGKGQRSENKPVLKNLLNRQLRQYQQILAFCSATLADGGHGACYVLIKRSVNHLS